MKYLQPYVYQVIREIVQKRISDRIVPYVASGNEVRAKILSDVNATIDELEADGLVSHGENINGIKLYRSKDDEKDNHSKTCK